jgi:hypothetical protein
VDAYRSDNDNIDDMMMMIDDVDVMMIMIVII